MLDETKKAPKHAYTVVSDGVLECLRQHVVQQQANIVPSYNLITSDLADLSLCEWDGESFEETIYHLKPLSTYDAYLAVYGDRRFNQSFIYVGENHVFRSQAKKEEAQRVRNELECQMTKAGKSVKHRELGYKSPLRGYPSRASYIMKSLPEEIALAGWYAVDDYQNTYITPSAWITPMHYNNDGKERQEEDLASFQSLVIDLDCELLHSQPDLIQNTYFMDILHEKTKTLLTVLFDGQFAGLPIPTIVHDTGRGLQLWYTFYSVSVKAKPLYLRLVDAINLAFNFVFSEYYDDLCINDYPVYALDSAVLRRQMTGWVRAFNSFNAEIHKRTQAYEFCKDNNDADKSKRQTIQTLIQCFETFLTENDIKVKSFEKTVKNQEIENPSTINIVKNTFMRRMDAIKWVIGHRQGAGSKSGWRDMCLFHFYNAGVAIMARDRAWALTKQLNARLTTPLNDSELHDVKYAVDNVPKGHYKYKTSNFLTSLNLTAEECDHVESILARDPEQDREARREAKKVRDARIEALGTNNNAAEVAKKVGVNEKTVRRKLKKAGINQKEIRNQKVLNMYRAGKTQKQIASELTISIKTVSRILKSREVLQ